MNTSQNILKKEMAFLNKLYSNLNERFFRNELPPIALTIQGEKAGAKNSLGWFWAERWQGGETVAHEINMTAENFNRPPFSLMVTLLHEMIHLDNFIKGVKDCTRQGRYHNKRFAAACRAVGLGVVADDKIGHRTPHDIEQQTEEMQTFYKEMQNAPNWADVADLFKMSRVQPQPKEKKEAKKTWLSLECPLCAEPFKVKRTIFENVAQIFCPCCGEMIENEGGEN